MCQCANVPNLLSNLLISKLANGFNELFFGRERRVVKGVSCTSCSRRVLRFWRYASQGLAASLPLPQCDSPTACGTVVSKRLHWR